MGDASAVGLDSPIESPAFPPPPPGLDPCKATRCAGAWELGAFDYDYDSKFYDELCCLDSCRLSSSSLLALRRPARQFIQSVEIEEGFANFLSTDFFLHSLPRRFY